MSKGRPKVKQCKRCYAHYQVSPLVKDDNRVLSGFLMAAMVQSPLCPHNWEFPK